MRSIVWLPAVAATLLAIVPPAQAMPVAAGPLAKDGTVTLVRDGCGPFGHRSHYGYCKENGDGWGGYDHGGYGGYGGYGEGGGRGYGGYGFVQRRGIYDDGGYGERRCFIRETYEGPVRVCR